VWSRCDLSLEAHLLDLVSPLINQVLSFNGALTLHAA
jgi:hypothetical protein